MKPQHLTDSSMQEDLNQHLIQEFDWLLDTIEWRWQKEFKNNELKKPSVPSLEQGSSSYKELVTHFNLNESQRLIFLLALAPFFIPNELTRSVSGSKDYEPITYGARKILHNDQFFPTGTTALFLLGGNKFKERIKAYLSLSKHPLLYRERSLIKLGTVEEPEPITNAFLKLDMEVIDYLVNNVKLEEFLES